MEIDMKTRNPVAKHARTFNKATVQADKKKMIKKGYTKHKGRKSDYHTVFEYSSIA